MNIFRFAGDMMHLFSVLVLLLKIHTIKSCAGTPILLGIAVRSLKECSSSFQMFLASGGRPCFLVLIRGRNDHRSSRFLSECDVLRIDIIKCRNLFDRVD